MKSLFHIRMLLLLLIITVTLLLFAGVADAKKKKQKSAVKMTPNKTKIKTKWSSSMDSDVHDSTAKLVTEEHGYYVKRTFFPVERIEQLSLKGPPFLAVPVAWITCENHSDCLLNFNSAKSSLSEGFLCDDDCQDSYDPICGRTLNEVAVFYNQCKLNVAKCRTHGYWAAFSFEECKKLYPQEVKYAENKFRASPYFREAYKSDESLIKNNNESYSDDMHSEKLFVQKLSETVTKENSSDHDVGIRLVDF